MKVLITGGHGQLGQCINFIKGNYPALELYFTNSQEFDITKLDEIELFFKNNCFDYVINCAAYTNVEQAEKEPDKAFLVNAEGVKNLANFCKLKNMILIHISTDYVFDGTKNLPYSEEDICNPINEYGKSKLLGEQYIQKSLMEFYIIRTSWLYSQFGKNFYKTIVEKSKMEEELTITTSETGTPTSANDLANFLLEIIYKNITSYGIFHFSNEGEATWYDFAKEIIQLKGRQRSIKLKKTDNYITFARRPKYSVLNKEKCGKYFNVVILDWKESLKKLIKEES